MKCACKLAGFAVLFLLLGAPLSAQQAALTGTVTDPSGAVVVGADITLTNEATKATRTAKSDADGKYNFPQLDPGSYSMEVKMASFKTYMTSRIPVPVGITSKLEVKLQIGAVAEVVTVEAETERINTTDASIGNPFSGAQVLRLPSLNLDPSGLLSLQAGVTFVPGETAVGGYSGFAADDGRGGSVNGSRSDQTNITLDGADVNDPQNGYAFASVLRATQASLQEFRVTTTNYNADQGRSGAAQVQLVTKSGSNQIHGTGYYAHRNEAFNANDFFANRSGVDRGKFRRHIYGAAAGGPLIKDRWFIFGNWEELRENLSDVTERNIPSMSFRDGVLIYQCATAALCSGGPVSGFANTHTVPAGFYGLTPTEMIAIDPLNAAGEGPNLAAMAHFQQYPVPNSSGTFDGINIVGFTFNAPIVNFFRTMILRTDFNIDTQGKHTLYWRGTLQDDNFVQSGPQFPGEPFNQTKVNGNRGFVLGYRGLLSPNTINTFRWGYTRISEQTAGQQTQEYVNFRFISNLQDYASDTFGRILPQHHFRDDFSYTRGKHIFSLGGETRFTRNKRFNNANSFHFFSLNPSWLPNVGRNVRPGASSCLEPGCTAVPVVASSFRGAYNDAAINLLGVISQATASYNFDRTGATQPSGNPVNRRFAVNEYEMYFQDQWRILPSLTITYGARYLLISPPWETNGNQVSPSPNLGDWFESRRQLMLAGIGVNHAPQISFALGGPVNKGPHYYAWDYNNWSPRLAVAWSPRFKSGPLGWLLGDAKTVFRFGYAIVYDRIGNALIASFDEGGSFGMSTNIDSTFGGCGEGPSVAGPLGVCPRFAGVFNTTAVTAQLLPPSPGGSFPAFPPGADVNGVPQPGSFAITSALDSTITTPYAHTINFSIGRSLPWDLSVEVGYVGRRGRNQLMIRDLGMPGDVCDPASGTCYFAAARQLLALEDAGTLVGAIAPIPFWENLFPSFGPAGINGGSLPCSGGTGSATQVAFELMSTCFSHPDTTVFPWVIDNFGFPGYMRGGPGDPDVDGDGIPDAPFAFFDDQFATVTAWSTFARSEYHGLQISFRKRMSHGFQFDFNYTLAKSLDMSSSVERNSISAGFSGTGGYSGSTINTWEPNLEYSFSDFDMRHQMNLNWIYELPFGKGRTFGSNWSTIADQLFGGWELSGILRANGGLPANIINARVWPTNWNLQGNATCGPSTSITRVAPCPATTNVRAATHAGVTQSSPNLFTDPDTALTGFRFTLPGQRGERNILRGDKYINWDMSLAKRFKLPWEGHVFTFRWEAFNVFNQVYFDTGSLSASIGSGGTFGDYRDVLGASRRMQLTLRYEF